MMGITPWSGVTREYIEAKQCRWVVLLPMPGDYTICMAMCGNGVMIGTEHIQAMHKQILKDLHPGRTECSVAVVGASLLAIVGVPVVTATIRSTSAAL